MTTAVTNTHLRGMAVTVLGDGVIKPNGTVDAATGVLTIADTVTTYSIGLPFTKRIVTLTPEIGSQTGSSQGNSMRIGEVTVRVIDSLGLVINNQQVPFRRLGRNLLDAPMLPVSGEYRMEKLGWERGEAQLDITHDQPLPLHVLSVIKKITIND